MSGSWSEQLVCVGLSAKACAEEPQGGAVPQLYCFDQQVLGSIIQRLEQSEANHGEMSLGSVAFL